MATLVPMHKAESRERKQPPTSMVVRLWAMAAAALGDPIRLVRFAATGGICGVIQLAILFLLERAGWNSLLANATGFAISAQVNFLLSNHFIWGDRGGYEGGLPRLARRWVKFHGSIAGTALLNMAVFAAASTVVPSVIAGAIGIGVAAAVNFLIQDRLVFAHADVVPEHHEGARILRLPTTRPPVNR